MAVLEYANLQPMENWGRFGVDEISDGGAHYMQTTTFNGTQNFSITGKLVREENPPRTRQIPNRPVPQPGADGLSATPRHPPYEHSTYEQRCAAASDLRREIQQTPAGAVVLDASARDLTVQQQSGGGSSTSGFHAIATPKWTCHRPPEAATIVDQAPERNPVVVRAATEQPHLRRRVQEVFRPRSRRCAIERRSSAGCPSHVIHFAMRGGLAPAD